MTLKSHETTTEPAHRALREPARLWFEALRDRLCAAFEAIEDDGRSKPWPFRTDRVGPRRRGSPRGRRA